MRLVARNVAVDRGGRRLFSGLSFVVEAGQALMVVGANGAGKSSLLRAIAGLLRTAEGDVRLEGGDEEKSVGEQAHFIAHADALKNALTAGENLEFWAGALGAAAPKEAARTALASVGLAHVVDMPVGVLSAGQKRRAALARALVVPRPLWLLDEPTTALDAAARALLAKLMGEHLSAAGLIVAATHSALGLEKAATLKLGDVEAAA